MIKQLFIILLCALIVFTGCGKKKSVTKEELKAVNDAIIAYFSSDSVEYDNLGFHYVDEEKKVVVVGLLDNGIEKQVQFKKLVVDSDYIRFVESTENINSSENFKYT